MWSREKTIRRRRRPEAEVPAKYRADALTAFSYSVPLALYYQINIKYATSMREIRVYRVCVRGLYLIYKGVMKVFVAKFVD
jgi:hypothetical protein